MASEKDVHKWRQFGTWHPHPEDDWYLDVTKGLSKGEERLLLSVLDKCKKKGYAWASKEKLSKWTGISKSSVFRHLNKLYEYGWLKRGGFKESVMRLEPTAKAIKHFFE